MQLLRCHQYVMCAVFQSMSSAISDSVNQKPSATATAETGRGHHSKQHKGQLLVLAPLSRIALLLSHISAIMQQFCWGLKQDAALCSSW
jgi:hypothetical protein